MNGALSMSFSASAIASWRGLVRSLIGSPRWWFRDGCCATSSTTVPRWSRKARWRLSRNHPQRRSSVDLVDDLLGVPLEVLDLLLERLGVRAHDVRHPEADDAVRDALVLQALDAVGGVGVVRDHVHLEVVARVALLLADLREPGEHPVQLLAVAAGVHPAVALEDGAAQRGVDV